MSAEEAATTIKTPTDTEMELEREEPIILPPFQYADDSKNVKVMFGDGQILEINRSVVDLSKMLHECMESSNYGEEDGADFIPLVDLDKDTVSAIIDCCRYALDNHLIDAKGNGYHKDIKGNWVMIDKNNNRWLADEYNNLVIDEQYNKPIPYDEKGDPMAVDEDGNPCNDPELDEEQIATRKRKKPCIPELMTWFTQYLEQFGDVNDPKSDARAVCYNFGRQAMKLSLKEIMRPSVHIFVNAIHEAARVPDEDGIMQLRNWLGIENEGGTNDEGDELYYGYTPEEYDQLKEERTWVEDTTY